VKYDDVCPECDDAEVARIPAELAVLRLTDRYCRVSGVVYERPAFRCVEYGVESCWKIDSPLSWSPTTSNFENTCWCVTHSGSEFLDEDARVSLDEFTSAKSPPQSPYGTRHWSAASPASPSISSASVESHNDEVSKPFQLTNLKYGYKATDLRSRYYDDITVLPTQVMGVGESQKHSWCKYGTHRVLDQPNDNRQEGLCFGHLNATTDEEKYKTCPRFWSDRSY